MFNLLRGDCLELMKDIPDGSVDMILCDLPYGTTRNRWDSALPLDALWKQYKRIIKPNGCIALFAQAPFDKVLAMSMVKLFRYEWIWQKTLATGFLNAHKMPLKAHENILIFYKKPPAYHPQWGSGEPYSATHRGQSANYDKMRGGVTSTSDGKRFPIDVIKIGRQKDDMHQHPTQKPVKLCEYLIKTYTDPGEIVLDNCMGSGSTGVACVNTGRRFIGIELDEKYFGIAERRVKEALERMRADAENRL